MFGILMYVSYVKMFGSISKIELKLTLKQFRELIIEKMQILFRCKIPTEQIDRF
jgi:hypothetical protein